MKKESLKLHTHDTNKEDKGLDELPRD
jgi:hypothetical protein